MNVKKKIKHETKVELLDSSCSFSRRHITENFNSTTSKFMNKFYSCDIFFIVDTPSSSFIIIIATTAFCCCCCCSADFTSSIISLNLSSFEIASFHLLNGLIDLLFLLLKTESIVVLNVVAVEKDVIDDIDVLHEEFGS